MYVCSNVNKRDITNKCHPGLLRTNNFIILRAFTTEMHPPSLDSSLWIPAKSIFEQIVFKSQRLMLSITLSVIPDVGASSKAVNCCRAIKSCGLVFYLVLLKITQVLSCLWMNYHVLINRNWLNTMHLCLLLLLPIFFIFFFI